jgi:hypothetical protein
LATIQEKKNNYFFNFKKKKKTLSEALDNITNSLSHKQIVFQRNESLESGVLYYVFRLTSLKLKKHSLIVGFRAPAMTLWGSLKNFGALWSLRLQQKQPKIRPHLLIIFLFVSSCDQQCLLCEAKICHPNLIP